MSERIFIAVAWPYANGSLHLGQIAGAYLPPDIFARYHRTKGNEVLMVSGSDQHGTPITIKAGQEGKKPDEIAAHYHREFLESWQRLGISFDLFTTTGTANHAEVTQDIFRTLLKKNYIYKSTMSQPFCAQCQRFLADRYIEGTCPYCQSSDARGDQCETCGKPLSPAELVGPQCRLCGTAPVFRDSEHFFLRLTAFNDRLLDWIKQQTHWRPNVLNFSTRYLEEGLKDRAITRDIEWGVKVPVSGFENKRIYVWFEAVIGYLSAAKEWAKSSGDSEKWRSFWQDDKTKGYYFIGKDNIPFHTLIWPAMLMGYAGLNLPYNVPANEFLTIEGRKLSTSHNWAVWLLDYLARYDPDPLRYLLSINMPETADTDFSWREFVRRNNDELVATYGNLVHRVTTFTYRNFDGRVPTVGELDNRDKAIIKAADNALEAADGLLYRCHFREAIRTAISLAQEANRYLDNKAPWKALKEDRPGAARSLYTALCVIARLKTMLYPFLPFSSQKLHELLGFQGKIEERGWQPDPPPPGQKLLPPEPLFSKLDDKLVEEETDRLGQSYG
ncbi:MAG: methionine--tRNA ligase [Dehalococcoidales bacterium]|jgi:methionyl-tRNA synthetase|nr:methionine--tRNA ligase [Dehalococcoidales bacterium]MDP6448915.1 methionine--tRNA ligase [Dehalococcoidales bacterium]MDP6576901.1 methionine--tRNA ligase [Dehalococcoidales bacterium]